MNITDNGKVSVTWKWMAVGGWSFAVMCITAVAVLVWEDRTRQVDRIGRVENDVVAIQRTLPVLATKDDIHDLREALLGGTFERTRKLP